MTDGTRAFGSAWLHRGGHAGGTLQRDRAHLARLLITTASDPRLAEAALQEGEPWLSHQQDAVLSTLVWLSDGMPLSRALEESGHFASWEVALVRLAERTPRPAAALEVWPRSLEAFADVLDVATDHPLYLLVLLAAGFGCSLMLERTVSPTFRRIAGEGLAQDVVPWLPAITGGLLLGVTGALLALGVLALAGRRWARARVLASRLTLAMPLTRTVALGRSKALAVRALSLAWSSGASVPEGLELAARSLPNVVLSRELLRAASRAREGMPLADLPPGRVLERRDLTHLARVLAGPRERVAERLERLAVATEQRSQRRSLERVALLEPVGTVVAGVLVALAGWVVFSLLALPLRWIE